MLALFGFIGNALSNSETCMHNREEIVVLSSRLGSIEKQYQTSNKNTMKFSVVFICILQLILVTSQSNENKDIDQVGQDLRKKFDGIVDNIRKEQAGLGAGAIVGIVFGCLAGLAIIGAIIYFVRRWLSSR
ncbi:unnamed protein product [Trichobilharzia szidati]|nr:unnamed protein product [Trichobilharzia szidati]